MAIQSGLKRILARAGSVEWLDIHVRTAMQSEWDETRVTLYLGANSDMRGDLVVASVQKLTRPEGIAGLDRQRFDYVGFAAAMSAPRKTSCG